MGRQRYSEEKLATMPERKRKELLRQRIALDARRKANEDARRGRATNLKIINANDSPPVVTVTSAPVVTVTAEAPLVINGLENVDPRATELYIGLRARLMQDNRWSGEASHGTLLTYVLCTIDIESNGVSGVAPAILVAQAKARDALKLLTLPPEKEATVSRFGGAW